MVFSRLVFRVHAIQRMYQRVISEAEVRHVISTGEIVEDYPDDTPYPSRLAEWGPDFKEKDNMKCVVCKKGETKIGKATVTLDKDGTTLVFKGVPARVCTNCGEEYVDGEITASLLRSAAEAARSGIQVEIRQYSSA